MKPHERGPCRREQRRAFQRQPPRPGTAAPLVPRQLFGGDQLWALAEGTTRLGLDALTDPAIPLDLALDVLSDATDMYAELTR